MPLPTLCDPVTVRAMLAQETRLMDLAEGIASGPCPDAAIAELIAESAAAVRLANELACCHESDNPADRELHHCATQLKCWHLTQIDNLSSF